MNAEQAKFIWARVWVYGVDMWGEADADKLTDAHKRLAELVTEAEAAARETALAEAEAVCRERNQTWYEFMDARLELHQQRDLVVQKATADACADAIRALARSAAASAEAQPAGEGAAGRAKG